MEQFASKLSFDLPASTLNFDTFSAFRLQTVNETPSAASETALAENLLRKLSEKIGRELSGRGSDSSLNMIRNQIVLNGTNNIIENTSAFPNEDWIHQAEYDKFMNEIWIGIVLTLVVISMVFCICSCFLYHQFRQWKANYHRNIQSNNDIESIKLNIEDDDLPSYTLVSGLPSYDAALEQIHKSSTSNSCFLMHPSVFQVFTENEKENAFAAHVLSSRDDAISSTAESATQQYHTVVAMVPSYHEAITRKESKSDEAEAPSLQEALLSRN